MARDGTLRAKFFIIPCFADFCQRPGAHQIAQGSPAIFVQYSDLQFMNDGCIITLSNERRLTK